MLVSYCTEIYIKYCIFFAGDFQATVFILRVESFRRGWGRVGAIELFYSGLLARTYDRTAMFTYN